MDDRIDELEKLLQEEMQRARFWTGRAQINTVFFKVVTDLLLNLQEEKMPGISGQILKYACAEAKKFRDQYWPLIPLEGEPGYKEINSKGGTFEYQDEVDQRLKAWLSKNNKSEDGSSK